MKTVLRYAQTTIDWANGDPTKGNLVVGSPLAVALALRGVARSWFGSPGWREDLDDALALAEDSAESLTLPLVVSWLCGQGTWNGVKRADEATIRIIEKSLRTAEASGDDYAVAMSNYVLGTVLLRGETSDRHRGLPILISVRSTCEEERFLKSELPIVNIYLGREHVRDGDLDGGIAAIRKAVDDLIAWGQVGYYVPAVDFLVEALLLRNRPDDLEEAQSAATKVEAAPAEGSVIRDIWLLRSRTRLARAKGDDAGYRELRDRYGEMATSLSFEGHMQWAAEML